MHLIAEEKTLLFRSKNPLQTTLSITSFLFLMYQQNLKRKVFINAILPISWKQHFSLGFSVCSMKKLEGLANFSRKPPPLPIFCCVHVWLAKNAANCNKRLALCCVQGFTTTLFFAVCNFWGHPKKVAQAYKKRPATDSSKLCCFNATLICHSYKTSFLFVSI